MSTGRTTHPRGHRRGGAYDNDGNLRYAGPPPTKGDAAWKRQVAVSTYLTPQQKEWVVEQARTRGVSVSECFRALVAECMART